MKKKNEGYIVVISLVVATAVLLLLGVFWGSIVAEKKNIQRSYHSMQALNLAEAGVEKAIWELNNNRAGESWTSSDLTLDISGETIGKFDLTVVTSGSTVTIQASGHTPGITIPGNVTRKVKVIAESSKFNPFTHGLFANEGPIVFNDSFMDSYVSNLSSYTAQATHTDPESGYTYANSNASVGTNSATSTSISVDESSKIFGKTVLDAGINLVSPVVPDQFDYTYAGLSVSGSDVYEINEPGSYWVGFISISGNGRLQINASSVTVYVAGDVKVNDVDITGKGEIRIASGCTASFYVNGDLKVAGNGMVNLNEDPASLAIYGTENTSNISIMGNASFCGLVYAPQAHVRIKGATGSDSAVLYGSVVSNSIEIGPHGKIHYDETLKDRDDFLPAWSSKYNVVQWEEKY